MNNYLNRLATFRDTTLSPALSPMQLAKEGFYVWDPFGTDPALKCFACGKTFDRNGNLDNLQRNHNLQSPSCKGRNNPLNAVPTLPGITTARSSTATRLAEDGASVMVAPLGTRNVSIAGNIGQTIQRICCRNGVGYNEERDRTWRSQLRCETARFTTFHNWPKGAIIRPLSLAKSGFYYTGSSDKVECIFCEVRLENWTQDDIPDIEHRRECPECPFVKKNFCQPMVKTVRHDFL